MHRSSPLSAIVAIFALWVSACARTAPPVAREWPAFTSANGSNALDSAVRFVKNSPRHAGTAGAAYAAQWIAQELRTAGLKPVADTWREIAASGPMTFSNIYADLPGTTNRLIVIGSHFDTKSGIVPVFMGANDGGSSVGVVLELARLLRQGPPLRHTVRFAFFDGEECVDNYRPNDGLHGSRRMATHVARGASTQPVAGAIILDMVGDQDLRLEIPRNVTPWLAKVALDAATASGYPQLTIARGAIIDDHWPFIEQGIPAMNLIDFDYGSVPGKNDYWHTSDDTPDKLSVASLTMTGRIALEMIRRIDVGLVAPESLAPPRPPGAEAN